MNLQQNGSVSKDILQCVCGDMSMTTVYYDKLTFWSTVQMFKTFAFGFDVHALRLHRCRISHLLLLVLEWLLQLISWSHWLLMKTNIPLHDCWLLISCGSGLHYQWHCWIMWLQRKPGTFTLNVYFDILLHKCQLVLTESFHYCICEQSDVCHISQCSVRTPVRRGGHFCFTFVVNLGICLTKIIRIEVGLIKSLRK